MRKVLIISNHILGIYNFRRELVKTLLENNYQVTLAVPSHEKKSYFIEMGCEFVETPLDRRGTNPISDFKLLMNYYRIIKRIRPDIVLTYTIKPNIYGGLACRILKIPYLANITGLGSAVENKGLLQMLTVFLYRISLKDASSIFFQNEENRQFMIKNRIAIDNNILLPGSGVNLEYFKLLDYPPSDKKVVFLFIGRIIKEKGIDQYLEAAEYFKDKYPYTEFHILGRCDDYYYNQKLKEMQKRDIIVYHGRQDDVRDFHKISHCTIHPTYYPEGMSNVLLESAACGRPIITTDRSGCREIVDNNVTGFIIEQKNSIDLIEKIEKFLKLSHEEKVKMGLEGRKKVEKEFDRNIVTNSYLKEISKNINKTK